MSLQIIDTESKKDNGYQEHIAQIALADAEHDLGDVLTPNFSTKKSPKDRSVYNAFIKGLPKQINYSHYSEPYTLSRTMGLNRLDAPSTLCDTDATCDSALADWSTDVTDVTLSNEGLIPTNIKVNVNGAGTANFNYNVVKFILPCGTNSKREPQYKSYNGSNFGCDFFANTGLGGPSNKAAFIVDFNQHGFLEKLKQGDNCDNTDYEIIYLMTSEVVNDPAPKPNIDNKSIFNHESGIKTSSWVQTGPEHIMFTTFDNDSSSPLNNFFSKYDFTMSPIKQTFVKKGSSLSVNLVASYNGDGDKPALLATIEDSKKQNSIESVLGYIRNLINKIVSNKSSSSDDFSSDDFNFNVKCQQKRGGDWFQVLACLDARNREYVQILPSGDRSVEKLESNCPIYFVTHDRIAVAYALMNGVNVVYLDYYGGVFVFKNTKDDTTTSGDIEKMMFNSMKTRYYKENLTSGEEPPIVELISSAEKYQTARESVLDTEKTKFMTKLTAITSTINTLTVDNLTNYFKSVQDDILRDLFKAAVELMFVIMNLPDIQGAISFVVENKNIFVADYKEDMKKETVVNMSRSLNTINGIFDRFGAGKDAQIPIPINFQEKINLWLTANLQLLNVYKIASKLEIDYTVESTSTVFSSFDKIKRMFSISQTKNDKNDKNRTNETISYDKHTFLPFIKTLDNTYKKAILDNLTLLHEKNSAAAEKAKTEAKGKLFTRHSNESTDQKKCNYIANLIYESLIIVELNPDTSDIVLEKTAEATREEIKNENGFVSISRDVDIMNEDTEEIKILKSGDGKVSNNTTELYDETVAVGGGTGFTEFGTGDVVKKNTVLDMNANQMTWPLFSYVLQDAYSLSSLQNSLKSYKTYVTDTDDSNDDIVKELQEKINKLKNKERRDAASNIASNVIQAAPVVMGAIEYATNIDIPFIPAGWMPIIGGFVVICKGTYELYKRGYIPNLRNKSNKLEEGANLAVTEEVDTNVGTNVVVDANTETNTETNVDENITQNNYCQGTKKDGTNCKKRCKQGSKFCHQHQEGGAGDDEMVVQEESDRDLLKDFDLCYHPLMPIYMLLSPFYYTLGPKYEGNSFFYTYFTYVNVLEKMVDVLDEKYLNNPTNNVNVIAGYLIGLTLSGFLFSSGTNIVLNDKILEVVSMSQEDYGTFSLKNDSFASLITGSIHLSPEEEMLFFALLDSELFKNFINVEVNIKQILENGTSVDDLPSYTDLQARITGLMNRIVNKVNVDRLGIPEGDEGVAAGVQIPEEVSNVEEQPISEETSIEPENNVDLEEQEKTLQKFKELSRTNRMRTGPRSMRPSQLNILPRGIRVGGGKKLTKNRCKKRTCTRKQKGPSKKVKLAKKTRKHKRSHKHTRKNVN